MINSEIFDQPADDAAERYAELLASFRSIFFATTTSEPSDIRNRLHLNSYLTYTARKFMEREQAALEAVLWAQEKNALHQAEIDLGKPETPATGHELSQYGQAVLEATVKELETQTARDILKVMRRWQEFAIEYQMRRYRSIPEIARFQAIENAKFRFSAEPPAGSVRFARLSTRYALLTLAFETYAMDTLSMGGNHMVIVKDGQDGDRLDYLPDNGGKTFADVRDEVFHPNSTATLRVVV